MSQNIIVGLDIGSHAIKGSVGVIQKDKKLRIIKAFRYPSAGMRRGMVVDMEAAVSALEKSIGDIRSVSRAALKRVYVNLGSPRVEVKRSQGFVVVSRGDDIISSDDKERVIQASQAINLPSNRDVVHTIPREFIVDGVGDVQDPVGLSGARLEVDSFIIHAFSPDIRNLYRCAEEAGFSIFGLIFSPLAAAMAVLSKNQLELGAASVDIGANTTSVAIFEEGQLVHAKILPIGAAHVTNDIAIGLKVPLEIAEEIKLTYGSAQAHEVSRKENVALAKISSGLEGEISRKFISEIIEIRLAEIMDIVGKELKEVGRYAKLPGGAVLSGGGAKMPGMADLAKRELRLPVQIGTPVPALLEANNPEIKEYIDDPEMALAFGLLLWGMEGGERKRNASGFGRGGRSVGRFLKQFLP